MKVTGSAGEPAPEAEVLVEGRMGREVARGRAGGDGGFTRELAEYSVNGVEREKHSPYTVRTGWKKMKVELNRNLELGISLK